jgi:hypothetical protein
MVGHPIEANFYVHVTDAEVEVIFAPTLSRYIYSRLLDAIDLLSPNPVVRHPRRRRDIGSYEPTEVQAMAYRVGLATIRRLMQSSARAASGPLVPVASNRRGRARMPGAFRLSAPAVDPSSCSSNYPLRLVNHAQLLLPGCSS